MRRSRVAFVLAAIAITLTGCGTHGATVTVAVTTESGQPLRDARVWLLGTKHRATSDRAGNAAIDNVDAGIYQVNAVKPGYVRQSTHVTVVKGSDPDPESLALPYAPPLGTFVYHPKSTEWLVLDVASLDPWRVTLRTIEWGCWVQTWDHHDDQSLSLDEHDNKLHGHPSIEIVGPKLLDASWRRLTPDVLPDTSRDEEPAGACKGADAAWDHSH
jgi:hypothetical protein